MDDLVPEEWFLKEHLFELFKQQLKKDFDHSSVDSAFISELPSAFEDLKKALLVGMAPLFQSSASSLQNLLYRIDIGELQIRQYRLHHPGLSFEEVIAELLIKRILQKIILRKKFST